MSQVAMNYLLIVNKENLLNTNVVKLMMKMYQSRKDFKKKETKTQEKRMYPCYIKRTQFKY